MYAGRRLSGWLLIVAATVLAPLLEAPSTAFTMSPDRRLPDAVQTSCTSFSISPTFASSASSAGSQEVTISGSPAGCTGGSWNANSGNSDIMASPSSGTGPGVVTVSWTRNNSIMPRTLFIAIANEPFVVNQAATSMCLSYVISPTSASPSHEAGSVTVAVSGGDCLGGSWGASGNGDWITTSPSGGIGPAGKVTVSWEANAAAASRSGVARIADRSFTVTQAGRTRVIGLSGDLHFGSVGTGTAERRTLTIGNSGTVPLTVQAISYPDGFSGDWSGSIPAGGSQPVPVIFLPVARKTYSGTITVESDQTSGTFTVPVSGTGDWFTEAGLAATYTIRGLHIEELRTRIGELRIRYGLAAFPWTDAALMAGVTVIRAVHITELRAALSDVYEAAGDTAPAYTDPDLSPATVMRAEHILELRAAVIAFN